MDIEAEKYKTLAENAAKLGWREAVYNYTLCRVKAGMDAGEDARSADWLNLIPSGGRDRAMVIGCGLGTAPMAASGIYKEVVALDRSKNKIDFLITRAAERGAANIKAEHINDFSEINPQSGAFDLISIASPDEIGIDGKTLRKAVDHAAGLLKNGGVLRLSCRNALSPRFIMKSGGNSDRGTSLTLAGYMSILRRSGFSSIKVFAPFPDYTGIPMFYVPLDSAGAVDYFYKIIFSLFDMVSPEVKKSRALEYGAAKLAVGFLGRAGWTKGLMKFFLPGFMFLAVKSDKPQVITNRGVSRRDIIG